MTSHGIVSLLNHAVDGFNRGQMAAWQERVEAANAVLVYSEQILQEFTADMDPKPTPWIRQERARIAAQRVDQELVDLSPKEYVRRMALEYLQKQLQIFHKKVEYADVSEYLQVIADLNPQPFGIEEEQWRSYMHEVRYAIDGQNTLQWGGSVMSMELGRPYNGQQIARMLMRAEELLVTSGSIMNPALSGALAYTRSMREARDAVFMRFPVKEDQP